MLLQKNSNNSVTLIVNGSMEPIQLVTKDVMGGKVVTAVRINEQIGRKTYTEFGRTTINDKT